MEWYYFDGETRSGPFTDDELSKMMQSGQLAASGLVCEVGTKEWVSVATFRVTHEPKTGASPRDPGSPKSGTAATFPVHKSLMSRTSSWLLWACLFWLFWPAFYFVLGLVSPDRAPLNFGRALGAGAGPFIYYGLAALATRIFVRRWPQRKARLFFWCCLLQFFVNTYVPTLQKVGSKQELEAARSIVTREIEAYARESQSIGNAYLTPGRLVSDSGITQSRREIDQHLEALAAFEKTVNLEGSAQQRQIAGASREAWLRSEFRTLLSRWVAQQKSTLRTSQFVLRLCEANAGELAIDGEALVFPSQRVADQYNDLLEQLQRSEHESQVIAQEISRLEQQHLQQ